MNKRTQQKAFQKQIEGLSFLKNLQGELVQLDFINLKSKCTTQFIEDLIILDSPKYITLDDNEESTIAIPLLKEQIFDIEEEYEGNKVTIHTVKGDFILIKL